MTEWITGFDFNILYALQDSIRCEFLDFVCAFLSIAFEGGILWFITALVMAFFPRTRTASLALVSSVILTYFIGELLMKNLIMRDRPCVVDPSVPLAIELPKSFSFPSGHTGSSFAAAFGIFFFNKKIGIPAVVVAALVGLSRLYLFVHFPTDVLAGALLGTLLAYMVYRIFRYYCVETRLQSLFTKH